MKCVVLNEPGAFSIEERPAAEPGEGEALVRVHRVGVCGTDLHAFAGRQPFFSYPRVIGHELAVEVIEAPGNSRGIRAGDRCAVEPYIACGDCRACAQGKTNCCENLQVMGVHTDGGMRPEMPVPVDLLYKSEKLSLDQLALVETLGIGFQAVLRSGAGIEEKDVPGGPMALVVGAGPIGLAALQFLLAAKVTTAVLDISEPRRQFVADNFGVEALSSAEGRAFDYVIDATGNRKAMEKSFDYVAFGGTLTFVGILKDTITFEDVSFHRRELTLRGSRNSAGLFPEIIRMIEDGTIDTTPWITHRYGLWEIPETFAGIHKLDGLVKTMIDVEA